MKGNTDGPMRSTQLLITHSSIDDTLPPHHPARRFVEFVASSHRLRPALGTFLSPDTLVPDPGAVIDYNRFLYARGNPVKYTDPSGHCEETPDDDAECWHLLQRLMDDPEVGNLYDYDEVSQWNGDQIEKLLQYWSEHSVDELTPDAYAFGVSGTASLSLFAGVQVGVKGGVELVLNHNSDEKSVFVYGGGHAQLSLDDLLQFVKKPAMFPTDHIQGTAYVASIHNLPANDSYQGEFETTDYAATYGLFGAAYGTFQVPGNSEGPHGSYIGWAPGLGMDLAGARSSVWYSPLLQIGETP